jgi:hypothetical protein
MSKESQHPHGRAPALDLLGPRDLNVSQRFRLEALEKTDRDFRTLLLRETQHLIE